MINITRKEDCVGCDACVQRCPTQCIEMKADEQGFKYPRVNVDACIDCHLCEKVCPVLNQPAERVPVASYAFVNSNKVDLATSSSGGFFTAAASEVIRQGGVVFGARFDENWGVVHDFTRDYSGLEQFKGSKYAQSKIGQCYRQAEEFLKTGVQVMFTGTPCQIAGLKLFLRKEYQNLLAVDVVCHGVPAPAVWQQYLKYIGLNSIEKIKESNPGVKIAISGISFRDKRFGWRDYGFSLRGKAAGSNSADTAESIELLYQPHQDNVFMQGFVKNLYLRPSCFKCPAKSGKSRSDITLGDFWGVSRVYPGCFNRNGVSLVLAYTEAGEGAMNGIDGEIHTVEYRKALMCNPSISTSAKATQGREQFLKRWPGEGISCIAPIAAAEKEPLMVRIKQCVKTRLKKYLKKN